MNIKMVFSTVGRILQIESLLLLLPLAVSAIYKENAGVFAFAVTAVIALVFGGILHRVFRTENRVIYAREGFAVTAFAWLLLSAVGALPFVLCGDIPSYIDAFFETVSGLTTTGASVIPDVTAVSKGAHMWRAFTHWIGGMGVLVFVMALMPGISDRSIHIMRAEVPGPSVGKLVPRIKDTAKILYMIYIALTAAEMIFLLLGGLGVYESMFYAFGTAGTGGFGLRPDGLASYSPYIQWVIGIFMLIFGINFNIYYFILIRRAKTALSSSEMWTYLGIITAATLLITANVFPIYTGFSEALRHSFFQISSIITTTGFATADFNVWPQFSRSVIFVLLFFGGCAGSTAGGLKISRIMILFKTVRREINRLIHPRSVSAIKMEGKPLEDKTIWGVCIYFAIYMICMMIVFLLLSFDKGDMETHLSAAISCFNNVGPGFSGVGPMAGYGAYSPFSKLLLAFAMLFGRLEIFPMLIALSPRTWAKK